MGRTSLLFWAVLTTGFLGWERLTAGGELVEVTRVKIEQYLAGRPASTEDPMIRFERRYLAWGAIDSEEYREREGKYFAVFWKSKEPLQGAAIRLEYLQAHTGKTVHVQEVPADQARRGSQVAYFQVTGPSYHKGGDVLAWKVSIHRAGIPLAEKKSFLWVDR